MNFAIRTSVAAALASVALLIAAVAAYADPVAECQK